MSSVGIMEAGRLGQAMAQVALRAGRDLATGGAMQQIHHPLAGVRLIRESD
jgi:hypothetical protein